MGVSQSERGCMGELKRMGKTLGVWGQAYPPPWRWAAILLEATAYAACPPPGSTSSVLEMFLLHSLVPSQFWDRDPFRGFLYVILNGA